MLYTELKKNKYIKINQPTRDPHRNDQVAHIARNLYNNNNNSDNFLSYLGLLGNGATSLSAGMILVTIGEYIIMLIYNFF